jgi:iron complex outermembrane receptor protein
MPEFPNPSRRAKRLARAGLVIGCVISAAVMGRVADDEGQTPSRANPAEALELPTVNVIGTTPLPSVATPIEDVPANVQVYSSKDLSGQNQATLTDFLERNAGSITANSAQGNPFQPDINFRGFTASPLLGTPQGVSVFQDGVRINEPFGDVVNWDLVPQSAIAGLQLIPGSNPAFGLNTLGGALSIYTKSGADYPGGDVQVSGGSFGRKTAQAQWGGATGPLDYFVTGEFFDDRGWADHNPSRVRQFFAKVGWQNEKTDFDVSLTGADNRLQGTQTLPLSFLNDIYRAYTFPDLNSNKLTFLTLKGSRFLSAGALLGGNAYYRNYKNQSTTSNVNNNYGSIDPITGAVNTVQATNDRSAINQESYGGGLQLELTGAPAGRANVFTLGASLDAGHARFTQSSQDALFTAARDTVGINGFSLQTDADTSSRYIGVFATDTLHLDKSWTLTTSGRFNRADIQINDRTGAAPLLNGQHAFSRVNPSIGLTFHPTKQLTAYASYNEGVRPPTAIELTCADPDAPCKLPNNFLADPPLRQIVSRTAETGARGEWQGWQWSAALYRTDLSNDIQFISAGAGASNAGYFANVGATRRQGLELSASTQFHAWSIAVHYSYTDATFRSSFVATSHANSSADANGAIQVRPGDRIPGVPAHSLKLRLDRTLTRRLSAGATMLISSPIYPRGDENNQDAGGTVPGYVIINLDAKFRPTAALEFFASIANLLDRRYANFAVLGQNFFTGPNRTFGPAAGFDPRNEQFRGVGAPFGIWVGARYALGAGGVESNGADRD